MVDDILRQKTGLNYDTAVAAQEYINQILTMRATSKKGYVEASRRRLRRPVVASAQHMWEQGNAQITKFKGFCSTADLPRYLLPARSLDEAKMYLPYDSKEVWLEDPTMRLKRSRAVSNVDVDWIGRHAEDMLRKLAQSHLNGYTRPGKGGTVTTWVQAAMAYHMTRIEATVTVDHVMSKIVRGQKRKHAFRLSRGREWRLEVILQKLGIHRGLYRELPRLNTHGLHLAEATFKKIIQKAIITCHDSGLLALPRGLEGVLNHFRLSHPQRFWNDDWSIIG